MPYRAGSAFIAVSPSFRGFQTKVATEARKLGPIKIPVEYDTRQVPVVRKPKPIKVPVTFDMQGGSFERKLQTGVRKALAALPDAEIGASTSAAEQKIKDLRGELATLADKRIGVDISDTAALAEARRLQKELERISATSPNIQVHADTGTAAAELAAVRELANRLDGDRVNVPVDADTGAAESKLTLLQSRLLAMSSGRTLIKVAVAASPLAIPAAASLVGGGAALAGIGAGVAGGAGVAALGLVALNRAVKLQKELGEATKARQGAVDGVRSAETSLASAQASAGQAAISSARSVADAERGVADARRQGARAVTAAEEGLADARRQAARVARDSARQVADAQAQMLAANKRVQGSEKGLHQARVQAQRDLDDLAAKVRQNALDIQAAQFGAEDAQRKLLDIESNVFASSNDVARVRLDAAQAEEKLGDARRQGARDAAELAKAQAAGPDGSDAVKAAQAQLDDAKADRARARVELARTQQSADQARADAARNLAQAETALGQARADAARGVADAERNLARSRADAASVSADSAREVAEARQGLSSAQAELAAADKTRLGLLMQLTPMQKRVLAGFAALQAAWGGFLRDTEKPVGGATLAAFTMLEKALPALARFVRPVARGLRDVFTLFGNAAASKGAKSFARDFGVFSGRIVRDAGKGTLNLARGLGNLLRAFMPLSTSMSGGLVKLTGRFARWSSTVGDSKGFKRFIGYVRTNGPLLLSTLAAVGRALIAVAVAMAPVATAMLQGLRAFAGWLKSTAEAHPQLIRIVGVTALLVAGFSAVAGPLGTVIRLAIGLGRGIFFAVKVIKIVTFNLRILFMVMRLSPIGLIVTGIALLVVGFILAYKKVGWFRRGVDTAMRFIKTAITTVFGWVKDNWPLLLAILTGPFGLATLFIVKHWKAIKDATKTAVLWVVDKVLWLSEKMLEAMAKAFGWAPKIGPKIQAALDEVRTFRKGVNAEMDAINDENVSVKLNAITIRSTQNKNAHDPRLRGTNVGGGGPIGGRGGRGPIATTTPRSIGGGGIIPKIAAPMGPVHAFASATHKQAHDLGQSEAERMQSTLRAAAARRKAAAAAARASGATSADAPASSGLFGRPVKNYAVTATWQSYPGHTGIDLAAPTGTPVFAAGAGRVIRSYDLPGSNPYNSTPYRSYGRVVEVQHNGFSTLYAHLSKRIATVGEKVARGALLGLVGMNGNATGPHLHFETRPGGSPVNPAPFMAARGLKFDAGGQLPQGLTLAYHGPSTPDKVLTDQQWQDIHRLATGAGGGTGASTFHLYDSDGKLMGSMRGIARKAVAGGRDLATAQAAAGMGGGTA